MITGRTYLHRGHPVVVTAAWTTRRHTPGNFRFIRADATRRSVADEPTGQLALPLGTDGAVA